ncbi:MAG: hypothetical protein A2749_01490 [Parcubacteria group bacterium RIFCSPHIGHO2_01_FULL_45_26]|nr:MAG: hypothetical protein A2749_01490 [Parcubacteria group bacterium RIFCSPHIGHO2_01_FULL_45_26]
MKGDTIGESKISKQTVVFAVVIIALAFIVLITGDRGGDELSGWKKAAEAKAENPGFVGISEQERYDQKSASKARGDGAPVSAEEQQVFLDVASMPAR